MFYYFLKILNPPNIQHIYTIKNINQLSEEHYSNPIIDDIPFPPRKRADNKIKK